MFVSEYPYTNFHERNDDFLLAEMEKVIAQIEALQTTVDELVETGGTGITVDTSMSPTSTNPVTNAAIYAAIEAIYAAIEAIVVTVDTAMSSTSTNPVQNKVVYEAIEDAKSDVYSNFDSDQIANASTVNGDTVTEALQYLNASKAGTAVATTSSNGLMSATDKTNLDLVVADYTAALNAIG